jgi:hypothetical protein
LADLLAEQGRVDEAIAILRHHADTGHRGARALRRLADLLAEQGYKGIRSSQNRSFPS